MFSIWWYKLSQDDISVILFLSLNVNKDRTDSLVHVLCLRHTNAMFVSRATRDIQWVYFVSNFIDVFILKIYCYWISRVARGIRRAAKIGLSSTFAAWWKLYISIISEQTRCWLAVASTSSTRQALLCSVCRSYYIQNRLKNSFKNHESMTFPLDQNVRINQLQSSIPLLFDYNRRILDLVK